MMDATPRFLNGVFDFEGRGLGRPAELDPALSYTVPSDKRTQLIYLRAGNSLDELVYLVLTKNGAPMRYFPIGAKAAPTCRSPWSRTCSRKPSWKSSSPHPRAWPARSCSTSA